MDSEIRFEGEAFVGSAKASHLRAPLARELAEQVEMLADPPSQAVMYSDLYDHLRSGVQNIRRLLPTLHAHAAR